jgi:hypothetical protein
MIRQLERRRDDLERILKHREKFVEMIDWSAMTQDERDWARYAHTEELHMELWEIDTQLDTLGKWTWT